MITLEKFTEEDFDRLINWIKNEDELILFAGPGFSFPLTKDQLSAYINSDVRKIFKVVDSGTNEVIGHCELNDINKNSKSARVCRMLVGDSTSRNKGYGRKMLQALINVAFNELSLNNLTLKVYEDNSSAVKCYTNCGFEVKGKIHKSMVGPGKYWPAFIMSLTNN
ncbi:MAG: GNAT family N-acetyltransferase [Ignavibacteria bacterium]